MNKVVAILFVKREQRDNWRKLFVQFGFASKITSYHPNCKASYEEETRRRKRKRRLEKKGLVARIY